MLVEKYPVNLPTFYKMPLFFKYDGCGFQVQISINSKKDYLDALFILKTCGIEIDNPQSWRSRIKIIYVSFLKENNKGHFYCHIQTYTYWCYPKMYLSEFIDNYISPEEDIYKLKNLI